MLSKGCLQLQRKELGLGMRPGVWRSLPSTEQCLAILSMSEHQRMGPFSFPTLSPTHLMSVTGRSVLLCSRDDTGPPTLCVHPETGTEWEGGGFPGFPHWCRCSGTLGAHPVRGDGMNEWTQEGGKKEIYRQCTNCPRHFRALPDPFPDCHPLLWSCARLGCHSPLEITSAVIRSTGFRAKTQIQMPLGSLAPEEWHKAR